MQMESVKYLVGFLWCDGVFDVWHDDVKGNSDTVWRHFVNVTSCSYQSRAVAARYLESETRNISCVRKSGVTAMRQIESSDLMQFEPQAQRKKKRKEKKKKEEDI